MGVFSGGRERCGLRKGDMAKDEMTCKLKLS